MSEPHPILKAFLEHGGPRPIPGPLAESLKASILALDPEAGTALLAFEPDERFLQGAGVIQGGVVAAMLDFACAVAAFGRLPAGQSFGTVSLQTSFLKPCLPGPHRASARLTRMGARVIFAEAELRRDGSESLTATASAVMAMTSR